jgi:hypothetical protein
MFVIQTNPDGFSDLTYKGDEISPEEIIYNLSGPISRHPTRTSIQITQYHHIEDYWGKYINHSCDPTVKVLGTALIAVKHIQDNDSITFDYNSNEDVVSHPFKCRCCDKLIMGKSITQ